MKILRAPDPILAQPSLKIDDPTNSDLTNLADEMIEIMYSTNGCGLAAPQIGRNIRMLVIDCDQENGDKNPLVVLNPEITAFSDETNDDREGCLSVPGIIVKLPRATEIELTWTDLEGQDHSSSFSDLWARCFQHEIDHLNGLTMLDRVSGIRRIQVLGAYRKDLEKGAVPGSDPFYVV